MILEKFSSIWKFNFSYLIIFIGDIQIIGSRISGTTIMELPKKLG